MSGKNMIDILNEPLRSAYFIFYFATNDFIAMSTN